MLGPEAGSSLSLSKLRLLSAGSASHASVGSRRAPKPVAGVGSMIGEDAGYGCTRVRNCRPVIVVDLTAVWLRRYRPFSCPLRQLGLVDFQRFLVESRLECITDCCHAFKAISCAHHQPILIMSRSLDHGGAGIDTAMITLFACGFTEKPLAWVIGMRCVFSLVVKLQPHAGDFWTVASAELGVCALAP